MSEDKGIVDSNKDFELKCEASSSHFSQKHKNVFAFSEVTIKKQEEDSEESNNEKIDSKSAESCGKKDDLKDFKGRESLFRVNDNDWSNDRRPEKKKSCSDSDFRKPSFDKFAQFRKRSHPDRKESESFDRNKRVRKSNFDPKKYTKYSLRDVDLLNNRSNSQAAFDFLREIDERKQNDPNNDEEETILTKKIEFKKPTNKKTEESHISPKCSEMKKETKEKKKSGQMTLSHLMDEEEEEEEC